MADELANDGVVGNGLIINRFNDTQHTFSLDAPCTLLYLAGSVPIGVSILLEDCQFVDKGRIKEDVGFFTERKNIFFLSVPHLMPILDCCDSIVGPEE